jgi:hypothetical protein
LTLNLVNARFAFSSKAVADANAESADVQVAIRNEAQVT